MKNIALVAIFSLLSLASFSQKNDDGEMVNDILRLSSGATLKKGNILRISAPTGEDATFAYLFHSPENAFDDIRAKFTKPLEPYYYNQEITVRKIRFVKNSEGQGRWIVRFRNEKKHDISCDIVHALAAGEIQLPTSSFSNESIQPAAPATEKQKQEPVSSITDELVKLKKLLDDGVITQNEFDMLKQKLLNE